MESISFVPISQKNLKELPGNKEQSGYRNLGVVAVCVLLVQVGMFQSILSFYLAPKIQSVQSDVDSLNANLPTSLQDVNTLGSTIGVLGVLYSQSRQVGAPISEIVRITPSSFTIERIAYNRGFQRISLQVEFDDVQNLTSQIGVYQNLEFVAAANYSEVRFSDNSPKGKTTIELLLK